MMNFKMRFMSVVTAIAIAVISATAQETTPTMQITLDKAIELALSENPTIKVAERRLSLKRFQKQRLGRIFFLPLLLMVLSNTTQKLLQ